MDKFKITYEYLGSEMTTIMNTYTADSAVKLFLILNKNCTITKIEQIKG